MLSINDIIKINKIPTGSIDSYTLARMYLPIIGIDSYSLYQLINNLDDNEVSIKSLLDIFRFDSVGTLEYAFNKLEGIGLVKRFNGSKGILFVITAPLDIKSFMANSILVDLLVNAIGEVAYTSICEKVQVKLKGYKEETKYFDDIYKNRSVPKNTTLTNDTPQEINDNIKIRNTKFDYIVFKMLFSKDDINEEILDDSNFEEQILKISYRYNLNEQQMKEVVCKSILSKHDLDFEDIMKKAGYVYQSKSATTVIFPESKPEDYTVELTSEEEEVLNWAKSDSIEQMLARISGGKGSLIDLEDYFNLQEATGLPEEVINILIFHLGGTKRGQNLSFSYIEKVARNWMKAGIKTAKQALIFIRDSEEPKGKGRVKKAVEEPEWMKETKEEKSQENTEQIDDEASKKLIKKVFG